MPIAGLALPALSSLSGGGALNQGSSAGPAISGEVSFGGINFGPSAGAQLATPLVIGGVVLLGFLLLKGK